MDDNPQRIADYDDYKNYSKMFGDLLSDIKKAGEPMEDKMWELANDVKGEVILDDDMDDDSAEQAMEDHDRAVDYEQETYQHYSGDRS